MKKTKPRYDELRYEKNRKSSDFFVQLCGYFVEASENNIEEIDISILESIATNEKSVKILFDVVNFKVLHVTKNVETVLSIPKESMDDFINVMTNHLSPEHLLFVAKQIELNKDFLAEAHKNGEYSFKVTLCGLKFLAQDGSTNRVFVRTTPITFSEDGYPTKFIISIEVINFMMKSDIVWFRIAYEKDGRKTAYMASIDSNIKLTDIISDREKDVLKCLARGMDTEEISKTLFISSNTIIKHRKNMLSRTGLCDTTALIQICQACGILN
jgi:DNA-binding CsgD family transcriptional regulator